MLAAKLRCSSGPILGSATATMEPSRGAMKAPTQVSASSAQRRLDSAESESGGFVETCMEQ